MNEALLETLAIPFSEDDLKRYCQRWKVAELAVFGSILTDNFKESSDVDILVSFKPEAKWTLLDQVQMQDELAHLLKRNVDLISRRGLENSRNHIRREAILSSAKVIYATA